MLFSTLIYNLRKKLILRLFRAFLGLNYQPFLTQLLLFFAQIQSFSVNYRNCETEKLGVALKGIWLLDLCRSYPPAPEAIMPVYESDGLTPGMAQYPSHEREKFGIGFQHCG
jgi:hypothetical protein